MLIGLNLRSYLYQCNEFLVRSLIFSIVFIGLSGYCSLAFSEDSFYQEFFSQKAPKTLSSSLIDTQTVESTQFDFINQQRLLLSKNISYTADQLGESLFYLEDEAGQFSITSIMSNADDASFVSPPWRLVERNPSNFGYSDSSYWFLLPLENISSTSINLIAEVAYPLLDYVDFYVVTNGELKHFYKLGDKQPFSNRVFEQRNYRIALDLAARDKVDLYIRVKTNSSMQVPVQLWTVDSLMKWDQSDNLILGVYFGLIMVMALYNLMIYVTIRQRANLYYSLYVFSFGFFQASFIGLSFQYLWPESTYWNDQSILFGIALSVFFGVTFIRAYIGLGNVAPTFDLICRGAMIISLALVVLVFIFNYHVMIRVMIAYGSLFCILCIVGGLILWRTVGASIRLFTLGWLCLFIGGFVFAASKFGVLPRNVVTENAALMGSAVEIILLAVGLAMQINVERKQRFAAQQEAIVQERLAREAQEHALFLQKQDNEKLEERVKARTAELNELNLKLQELTVKDGLTCLYNRRYLDEKAEEEYSRAQRERNPLTVMIFDLDNFKQLNDRYGHQFGDLCLIEVSRVLKDTIQRTSDTVARYGGEEFVTLLPGASKEKARYLAEMIRLNIMSLVVKHEGVRVPLTVSVGFISEIPRDAGRYEDFLKSADDALYQAKANGRNCVVDGSNRRF